jgi:hypothetical protein
MKIEQIAAVIAALIQTEPAPQNEAVKAMGQNIVVLDRGFVYVGEVTIEGDFLRVTNAKNIRSWGTKNGLGELRNGPQPQTKLDEIGVVLAPMRALIHLVPCKGF